MGKSVSQLADTCCNNDESKKEKKYHVVTDLPPSTMPACTKIPLLSGSFHSPLYQHDSPGDKLTLPTQLFLQKSEEFAFLQEDNQSTKARPLSDIDELKDYFRFKCVALIAHNHMKPAMRSFINAYHKVLVNFRLIGTKTTVSMVKNELSKYNIAEDDIHFFRYCSSGPIGGDAEVSSELVNGNIGCVIFFVDPLYSHPHNADIQSLLRLARVHNVLMATNEMSAFSVIQSLSIGLSDEKLMPRSMTENCTSSAVPEYLNRKSVQTAQKLTHD